MLKTVWFVFYAEILLLWRRAHEWLYPIGFFLIVVCLFPIAFTPDPDFLQKYVAGCVWIAALLASLLSIENIFFNDLEDGSLEQLLLSPTPLALILFAKLFAHWIVTELPLILLIPLLGLFFHLSWFVILILSLSLLVGTPILTLIGALGIALTLGLRQQGALLGLLILPLVIPVLVFGINIVLQAQADFSIVAPFLFLTGCSILAMTLLPLTIAMTLRISFDD